MYDAGAGNVTVAFALKPVGDPIMETNKAANTTSRTANGQYQRNQDFIDEILGPIKHTFVTKTVADAFRTFFLVHGSKKSSFSYFIHNDEVATGTYRLVDESIKLARSLPGAANDFLYDLEYTIEKVV